MLVNLLVALSVLGLGTSVAKRHDFNMPCGHKKAPCPADMTCMPKFPSCTNLDRCSGRCDFTKKYPHCNGPSTNSTRCDANSTCRDDPRVRHRCGSACHAPKICVPESAQPCGGFAGLPCPEGLHCYDVPNDGCDPKKGGADCLGICL